MSESDDDQKSQKSRSMPWPGGPRPIEQPATPLPKEPDPLDFVADPELTENESGWSDVWPGETGSEERSDATAGEWPPASDDPQMPPRAWAPEPSNAPMPFVPEEYAPEDPDENIRRSGLAYSAGIVFFGSVAFMLFIGWLADLVLGSSPFGLVAGIVIGSAIGFVQFFHISKQIYEPSNKKPQIRSLMSGHDDDEDGA